MAFTTAQLTSAITASQLQFNLSSIVGTGLPVVGAVALPMGYPMMIDSEFMFVIAQPVAGTVVVRSRGSDGTAAASHDILANVYTSPTASDLPSPQPATSTTITQWEDDIVGLGQDQTIPLFGTNATYHINKATAAALTLTAPNLTDNGIHLVITSNTAAAHVVTGTGLIQDGTSTLRNTLTFAAQKGATIELVIENGFYNVRGAPQNVTIA